MDAADSSRISSVISPKKHHHEATCRERSVRPLCVLHVIGKCDMGADCGYLHGDVCSLCALAVLHPKDSRQRREHRRECIKNHEKEKRKACTVAALYAKKFGYDAFNNN